MRKINLKNFKKKLKQSPKRLIKKADVFIAKRQDLPDWVIQAHNDYDGELDCISIYRNMRKHITTPKIFNKVAEVYLLRLLQDYSWEWVAGIESVADWDDLETDFILWITRGEN